MKTLLDLLVFVYVFALGASIGSFLNVVIYRLPAGLSLIHPPSRCPKCFHALGKTENIPVLGWLRLGGKCRWCKAPISIRYPLIEGFTGLLFSFVFWQFGLSLTTLGYWVFLSWLLVLALIDLDTMTLPNELTQSGLVLGLIFQVLKVREDWSQFPNAVIFSVGGLVLGFWSLELIRWSAAFIYGKPAMGAGDPKLAAMIGAWLGWQYFVVSGFVACGVGAIIGGGAILLARVGRREPIPFGPFLALGAGLTVFWGAQMLETYIRIFLPFYGI